MGESMHDNDALREASRRSSDVMSAFAKRRHDAQPALGHAWSDRAGETPWAEPRGAKSEDDAAADLGRTAGPRVRTDADVREGGSAREGGGIRADARNRARSGSGAHARHVRNAGGDDAGGARPSKDRTAAPKTLGEFARQNSVFILSVVAVVAIVVLLIVFLRLFVPLQGSAGNDANADGSHEASLGQADQTVPLDWSHLDTTDGRYAYAVDGRVESRLGVDVSDHQVVWDWNAVASDGIDFAIIRLGYRGTTEGGLYLDARFEENLAGARDAGLDCGVYFFSQARTAQEAVQEADFVVDHLDGQKLAYPVVFDSEEAVDGSEETRLEGLSAQDMASIADAFCDRVKEAGYDTMVYVGVIDEDRYPVEFLQSRPIWWAEYDISVPSASVDVAMWQYTSEGDVAGIDDGADLTIDLSGVTS